MYYQLSLHAVQLLLNQLIEPALLQYSNKAMLVYSANDQYRALCMPYDPCRIGAQKKVLQLGPVGSHDDQIHIDLFCKLHDLAVNASLAHMWQWEEC